MLRTWFDPLTIGINDMNPIDIIAEFYEPGSKPYQILVKHGRQVADKAFEAAKRVSHLEPDLNFIKEAAMLHDIGIFETNTPELGCTGKQPYVCHGYLGREILDNIGLPLHGLVCERHVGVGISSEEIRRYHLPLPQRDMVPISIEEQIVCYADKFYSKNGRTDGDKKSVKDILNALYRYGPEKAARFKSWVNLFEGH
jgi:uncharacterized protein